MTRGRLIAVDGSNGSNVAAAALSLARALRTATGSGGVSSWDSSGIFTELAAGNLVCPARRPAR